MQVIRFCSIVCLVFLLASCATTREKEEIAATSTKGAYEMKERRSSIISITPEEKVNLDTYVGTWKSCGFSRGIGTDRWLPNVTFENSLLRYSQFFPDGDLWFTGDWTREKGWPIDRRIVDTIKNLHSWDGQDTVYMYGKVDHPEKRDFRLVKQDDSLYFSWRGDTYYVLKKVSDNPEIKVIE